MNVVVVRLTATLLTKCSFSAVSCVEYSQAGTGEGTDVRHDVEEGRAGRIAITFRPNGIRTLVAKLARRKEDAA